MWEQIRANRRRSMFLVSGLLITLIAIGFSAGVLLLGPRGGSLGVLIAVGIWAVQLGIYYFAAETVLLSGMNAREIEKSYSPRLFNIVEEMQLAAGLQYMPRIYLIETDAPNAFAMGRKPESCAIAVTTGLLYRLNRDELQGVIAHEIGHLKNRDVQFITLAGVMLGTVVILQEIMWQSFRFGFGRSRSRSSSRGSDSGSAAQLQIIIFVAALLIMILGPLLARMLYYACSRSREYLADASSAQYTRYPEGLASALQKISVYGSGFVVNKAVAPMFIVNPLSAADEETENIFSTHPATAKRVKILRAMSGAGITDYEQAYEQALGRSIIGATTLHQAKPVPARQPSGEGPIEERQDARETIRRLSGYVQVKCSCGMQMELPDLYERDEVRCIRCGAKLAVPSAAERYREHFQKEQARQGGAALQPLSYTRQGHRWESFKCSCGSAVQLSPAFSGTHTLCPKCGRQIDIVEPAGIASS